jgi:hypothetical protein
MLQLRSMHLGRDETALNLAISVHTSRDFVTFDEVYLAAYACVCATVVHKCWCRSICICICTCICTSTGTCMHMFMPTRLTSRDCCSTLCHGPSNHCARGLPLGFSRHWMVTGFSSWTLCTAYLQHQRRNPSPGWRCCEERGQEIR